MYVIHTTWYGWIPTNRGKLKFGFISLHKELKKINKSVVAELSPHQIKYLNLDISYLSDSYSNQYLGFFLKNKELLGREIPGRANIFFEEKNELITGSVEIFYSDFGKFSTIFECNPNGIIKFTNIHHNFDSLSIDPEEIKAFIYVLIKTIIHGDAHHHQKIDVALTITNGKFRPSEISTSLLEYIKLAERNVKKSNSCGTLLRHENLVSEIEGYLSYFKSFTLLFKSKEVLNDLEFAKCVFESLKSTVSKRKHKEDFYNSIYTVLISFLGLFISINILINGLWPEGNPSISYLNGGVRENYFWWSLAIILIFFAYVVKCKVISLVYQSYPFFEALFLIKNCKMDNLNYLGIAIKGIPFYLIISGIYIIVNYFANVFPFL